MGKHTNYSLINHNLTPINRTVSKAEREEIEETIKIVKTLKHATVKIIQYDRSDKIKITFPAKPEASEFMVSKEGGNLWILLLENDEKFHEVKSSDPNSRTFNLKG